MRRAVLVLLPVFLVIFATPVLAKDRRVPEQYETIQAAVDASNDGDRIYVHKGVYEERVVVQGRYGLQIHGKNRPDVEPGPGGTAFTFIDCEKVKVKGIDIDDAGSHAILFRDCVDGRVVRCRIRGGDADGVRIEGGRTYRIRNSLIEDVAGTGIHLGDSTSGPCRRVEVWECRIERAGANGISVSGQSYHNLRKNKINECDWAIVLGPDVTESRADNNKVNDGGAGAFQIAGTSNLCRKNKVRRISGDGIIVEGTDNWVSNNDIQKLGGLGIRVTGTAHMLKANLTKKIGGDGRVIEGTGHDILREKVKQAEGRGLVISSVNSIIDRCKAYNSESDGCVISKGATGNFIKNCKTSGSLGEGLVDESPEGANEYKNNSFR